MMKPEAIFDRLWIRYSSENPSAGKIYDLFKKEGNRVINDHVAFRTVNDPRVDLEVLAEPFRLAGYEPCGEYRFKAKKLRAKHFELTGVPLAPRVFISELILEEFSDTLRNIIRTQLERVPPKRFHPDEILFNGTLQEPLSYKDYTRLRKESEYAAWLYVYGFRANHFTVSINHLDHFDTIHAVNEFLKKNGFELNTSGGEIKGSPEQLLEQSSTLADRIRVQFEEGLYEIPNCYYEFAKRYPDRNGNLFSGFIAGSADKIFESTDFREQAGKA